MNNEILILNKIARRVLRTWPVLIAAILLWSLIGFVAVIFSPVFYTSQVGVMVEEPYRLDDPQRWILGEQRFNEPDRAYVINEGVRLKGYSLLLKALDSLGLGVRYVEEGLIMDTEIYGQSPITVTTRVKDPEATVPFGVVFYIDILDEKHFNITADDEYGPEDEEIEIDDVHSFGQPFTLAGQEFLVSLDPANTYDPETTYGFLLVNTVETALDLLEMIEVEPAQLESSIFNASLTTAPAGKARDILDVLSAVYVREKLGERRSLLLSVIHTINNELDGLAPSLSREEQAIEQYKSSNQINDLDAQGISLLEEITMLEGQLVDLQTRSEYLRYLEKNLETTGENTTLASPSAFGVSDPVLNELITEYTNLVLRRNAYLAEGQTDHPALEFIHMQVTSKADAIRETVTGFQSSNNIRAQHLESQVQELKNQYAHLPSEQMEMHRKDRSFNALDLNYRALQQRKTEVETALASLATDVRVVEPAHDTSVDPLFPDPVILVAVIVLLSLLTPFVYLFIKSLFHHKVGDMEELATLHDGPLKVHTVSTTGKTIPHLQSRALQDVKRIAVEITTMLEGKKGLVLTLANHNECGMCKTLYRLMFTHLEHWKIPSLFIHLDAGRFEALPTFHEFTESTRKHEPISTYLNPAAQGSYVFETNLRWSVHDHLTPSTYHPLADSLLNEFKLVVIVLPPLASQPDAAAFHRFSDLAILVARHGHTNNDAFSALLESAAGAAEKQAVIMDTPPFTIGFKTLKALVKYDGLRTPQVVSMLFKRI